MTLGHTKFAACWQVSPQYMVSCFGAGGCGVGTTQNAWDFFLSHGVPSDACYGASLGAIQLSMP
jgi:hypothetical protein